MNPQDPPMPPARPLEGSVRDHLANERTLLAWQRTALTLIGLGFVVDRFAFEGSRDGALGTALAIAMIAGGAVTAIVGAWRFVHTEHQIDEGTFGSQVAAHVMLAGAIAIGAVATGIYLLVT